jgi:hypothetical protein
MGKLTISMAKHAKYQWIGFVGKNNIGKHDFHSQILSSFL